jgi:hypothetical protein
VIAVIAHLVLLAWLIVFLMLLLALYKDLTGVNWPRRGK